MSCGNNTLSWQNVREVNLLNFSGGLLETIMNLAGTKELKAGWQQGFYHVHMGAHVFSAETQDGAFKKALAWLLS